MCIEFGAADPVMANRSRFRYLYVDSSREMMKPEDPSWRVQGVSVELDQRSKLHLTGASLGGVLANRAAYPGVDPWIGDTGVWRTILDATVGDLLGGQKRRLGRFLFSQSATTFLDRVSTLVSELERGVPGKFTGVQGCNFHIVCGLAGGTGSGSIVDAICLLRDTYPLFDQYKIRLYTYLPEDNPPTNWNTGNYHANGYAALVELNALAVGKYRPFDVRGKIHNPRLETSEKYRYSELSRPFVGCYLFTDTNENRRRVDVEKELPEMVAGFIFEKTVFAPGAGTGANVFERADDNENRSDTVEFRPLSSNGQDPLRTRLFQSFGVKRIVNPEEEIELHLGSQLGVSSVRQMLYNHWIDGVGYSEDVRLNDFATVISKPETLEKYLCSLEHLTASLPILDSDRAIRSWKTHEQTWCDPQVMSKYLEISRKKPRKEDWLSTLESLYQERFDSNYRVSGEGVKKFFERRSEAVTPLSKHIRNSIERVLLEEWSGGTFSLNDLVRYSEQLIAHFRQLPDTFLSRAEKWRDEEKNYTKTIEANRAEWPKIPAIDLFSRRDKILVAQADVMGRLMRCRTEVVAAEHARRLAMQVVQACESLRAEISTFRGTLNDLLKRCRGRAEETCPLSDGEVRTNDSTIKLYDPKSARQMGAEFTQDKSIALSASQAVRKMMRSFAGAASSISELNESVLRIGIDEFNARVEQECVVTGKSAHDKVADLQRDRRLLGVSVVEKFRAKYPSSDAQKAFAREVTESAGTFLALDKQEVNRSDPTIPANTPPSNTLLFLRPEPEGLGEFVKVLDGCIREASSFVVQCAEIPQPSSGDKSGPRADVMSLIRITNCFAARCAVQVKSLANKYDTRLNAGDKSRVLLEIHTETADYPSLFTEDPTLRQRRAAKWLAIGLCLDTVVEIDDQNSKRLAQRVVDEYGMTLPPRDLGGDFKSVVESIQPELLDSLNEQVHRELKQTSISEQDRKKNHARILGLWSGIVEKEGRTLSSLGMSINEGIKDALRDVGEAPKVVR